MEDISIIAKMEYEQSFVEGQDEEIDQYDSEEYMSYLADIEHDMMVCEE